MQFSARCAKASKEYVMKKVLLYSLLSINFFVSAQLKVLHISFHKGCINDFKEVAQALNLDLTSWYIHDNPLNFDGVTRGNAIYNIGHVRAQRVWERHKDYFNSFDVVITSDTTPLSRIFLQNNFKKPLIIWVCNRFDYCDVPSLDCRFPDQEYRKLLDRAWMQPNRFVVGYTPYEHVYARRKGVDTGDLTIKPIGTLPSELWDESHSAFKHIVKSETLFIFPRFDAQHQSYFIKHSCAHVGLKTCCAPYNGPDDLINFKGVIFIPYAWSNLALFENLQRGIIHFVPTEKFLRQLVAQRAPIRGLTKQLLTDSSLSTLNEWYCSEYRDLFIYFDSWQDLAHKVATIDYNHLQERIKQKGKQHRQTMLQRWQNIFRQCM